MIDINTVNVNAYSVGAEAPIHKNTNNKTEEEIEFNSLLDRVIKSEEELKSDKSCVLVNYVMGNNTLNGGIDDADVVIQNTMGNHHIELKTEQEILSGIALHNINGLEIKKSDLAEVVNTTKEVGVDVVKELDSLNYIENTGMKENTIKQTQDNVIKDSYIKEDIVKTDTQLLEHKIKEMSSNSIDIEIKETSTSNIDVETKETSKSNIGVETRETSTSNIDVETKDKINKDISRDIDNKEIMRSEDKKYYRGKETVTTGETENAGLIKDAQVNNNRTIVKVADESSIIKKHLTTQVEDKIIVMIDELDGSNIIKEAELVLNPTNLGKINIKMIYKDGKLTVDIEALLDKTKELIIESKSDIVNSLTKETGLKVEMGVDSKDNQIYVNRESEQNNKDDQRQNQSKDRNKKDKIAHGIFESMLITQEERVVRAY